VNPENVGEGPRSALTSSAALAISAAAVVPHMQEVSITMKPAVHLSWVLLLAVFLPACSDKSRRLGGMEAVEYKKELVRAHPDAISPLKLNEFMLTPKWTKGEIDAVFSKFAADYATEKAHDQAAFEASRRGSSTGPPTTGSFTDPAKTKESPKSTKEAQKAP
jgi:hypothetical protein